MGQEKETVGDIFVAWGVWRQPSKSKIAGSSHAERSFKQLILKKLKNKIAK